MDRQVINSSKGVEPVINCPIFGLSVNSPSQPSLTNATIFTRQEHLNSKAGQELYMQYSFRLAELLGHVPDPRKRPGTIKAIVEYTGLDRHQVAALLKNEVKYIPLKALSRLCDFLIEHGHASADQLPGALFSVCLLYTSPSPRDRQKSRMPSSA